MVFISIANFVRSRGPDEFWRKRKIFKLSAHYIGRKRNCYSLAIRNVLRALQYATKGRFLKKIDMAELWNARLTAAVEQHGLTFSLFREGLIRSNVLLNRKALVDLAIWEPFTFRALTQIAWDKMKQDKVPEVDRLDEEAPKNVIPREIVEK